ISKLWDVVEQMELLISQNAYQVLFPIEFRFVKGDQLSLSPSYGDNDRVYIAVHTYFKDDFYGRYFKDMEQIFLKAGGRPHWGKMFFAQKDDFAAMYPNLVSVNDLRKTFDPDGLLLTSTLKQ